MINYQFEMNLQSRKNFLALIDGYSLEQVNKIPDGFKNNLIWNFGHVICTQQILCYQLAGIDTSLDAELIAKYRKGTAPQSEASKEEIDLLKELAISTVGKLEADYKQRVFGEYKLYETSYGAKLTSIEDAITFNNVHEGLHYGYALALRKHLI